MNRIRLFVLSGFLALGGFALGASSAQAQSMGWGPIPTYSYVPSGGYYSGGYSFALQPATRGYYYAAASPAYRSPAWSMSHHVRAYSAFDPTGRHDGLARPWLNLLR